MAKLERTDKPVSVLLEELGEGVLGLPEIQRSYVWNRPQARDLKILFIVNTHQDLFFCGNLKSYLNYEIQLSMRIREEFLNF